VNQVGDQTKVTLYFVDVRSLLTHVILLTAELNPIWHLLALLGAHHILHVSRIRVNALVLPLPHCCIFSITGLTARRLQVLVHIYDTGTGLSVWTLAPSHTHDIKNASEHSSSFSGQVENECRYKPSSIRLHRLVLNQARERVYNIF